MAFALNALLIN